MATLTSTLVVKLLDQVSGPAGKVANALLGINNAAGKATAPYFADRLQGALNKNNQALAATRGRLVDAVAGFYLLKNAIGAPIAAAQELDAQLTQLGLKVGDTFDKIGTKDKLRILSRETTQSMSELTNGLDMLVAKGADLQTAFDLTPVIGKAASAYKGSMADLAAAGYAAVDNLKIPATEAEKLFDVLAQSGKDGAFEINNMAKEFPTLAAQYQALGQTGIKAASSLATSLQVAMKGAGSPEEAATNLKNLLDQINAPRTLNNFKKLGVNLKKEMKKAMDAGLSPEMAIAEIVNRTLKGDMSRLGELFMNAQAQQALRPLIANTELWAELFKKASEAEDVIKSDFQKWLETAEGEAQRLNAALSTLKTNIGNSLLDPLKSITKELIPVVERIADFAAANPKLISTLIGVTAGLIGLKVALIGVQYAALLARGGLISTLLPFAKLSKSAHMAATGNIALKGALAGMNGMKLTGFQRFTAGLTGMARAIPGVGLLGAALKTVAATVAAVFSPLGALIAGVVAAVVIGGVMIWKYWDRVSAVFKGVGRAIMEAFPALERLSGIGNVIAAGWETAKSAMSSFGSWLGSIFTQEMLFPGQTAGLENAGYDAAKSLIDGIKNGFTAFMTFSAEDFLALDFGQIGKDAGNALLDGIKAAFMDFPAWIAQLGEQLTSNIGSSIKGWLGFGDDKPKEPLPRPADPALARQFDRQEEKRIERDRQRQDRKLNYKTSLAQTRDILANLQSAHGNEVIPAPSGDPSGGSAAANETMDSFNSAFDQQIAAAKVKASQFMAELQSMISTTLQPTIRPKMDMSGISGVHADVGVE